MCERHDMYGFGVSPLQRKNAATLPPSTVVTSPVVFSAKA
jgi:hypothetical protein